MSFGKIDRLIIPSTKNVRKPLPRGYYIDSDLVQPGGPVTLVQMLSQNGAKSAAELSCFVFQERQPGVYPNVWPERVGIRNTALAVKDELTLQFWYHLLLQ